MTIMKDLGDNRYQIFSSLMSDIYRCTVLCVLKVLGSYQAIMNEHNKIVLLLQI